VCQHAAYTRDVLGEDAHRLRARFRTQGHELTGLPVTAGGAVTAAELRDALGGASD
jgi:hypothetical protein